MELLEGLCATDMGNKQNINTEALKFLILTEF